jgi:DNA-binding NtrC family response regulator
MPPQPILIIEDEHALATAMSFAVRRSGHLPTLSASGAAGLDALKQTDYGLIVIDIGLPDMTGLQVLERIRKRDRKIPILIVTAHATLDHAISAQKLGATQYLTKPLDLKQFEQTMSELLSRRNQEPASPPSHSTQALVGSAPCLQEVFVGIARACAGDMPVLIAGADGVGKSLAAQTIHSHSSRSAHTLRRVEAASITPAAWVELVSQPSGSLIIENLAQLTPTVQIDIAQWLSDTPSSRRIRLIATSRTDMRQALDQSDLRAELYYAFSTLQISIPPLHQRSGDIAALAAHFLAHSGSAVPEITPPAMAALQAYPWPGNVRELRHALDHACSLQRGGAIYPSHLPSHIAASVIGTVAGTEVSGALGRWLDQQLATDAECSYERLQDELETLMLGHLMMRFEHRPTHLANSLNMNRATLRQKLRRLGLQKDNEDRD